MQHSETHIGAGAFPHGQTQNTTVPSGTVAAGLLLTATCAEIVPGDNPRKTFDPERLAELARSIHEHTVWDGPAVRRAGLLQPLVVRREGGALRLVAGERRLRAVRLLIEGLDHDGERLCLPADVAIPVVLTALDDTAAFAAAITENVARAEMDELDEADAYARLRGAGWTRTEISRRVGVDRRTLNRRLDLAAVAPHLRAAVESGELSPGQALAVAKAPETLQGRLLQMARGGATVRALEGVSARSRLRVSDALFDVGRSGLELDGSAGVSVFSDTAAAMALQLGEVQRRCDLATLQGVRAEYRVVDDPLRLPGGLRHAPGGWCVYLIGAADGVVREHAVAEAAALASSAGEGALPLATAHYAREVRGQAMMAALCDPRAGLANLIVQTVLTHGGAVRLHGAPQGWGEGVPEVCAALGGAVRRLGGLVRSEDGALRLNPGCSGMMLWDALSGWALEDLAGLLAALGSGATPGWDAPAQGGYVRHLAGRLDVARRAGERFDLGHPQVAGRLGRAALQATLEAMPEAIRPALVPDTKPADLKEVAADRAWRARDVGWLPEWAGFGD